MVGNGSAGVEAILRRKPVVRYGFTYWPTPENSLYVHPRRLLLGDLDPEEISTFARRCESKWEELGRGVVHRLLSTLIPGGYMIPRMPVADREAELKKGMPALQNFLAHPDQLTPVVFPENFPEFIDQELDPTPGAQVPIFQH
jgi:hypothetical protein